MEIKPIKIPRSKRLFDIVVAGLFFLLALPFNFFILIWILIEQALVPASRGTLFYSELRISQGRPFKFYKWRIFKAGAIAEAAKKGVVHTAELQRDKNNFTYYGKFLQKIYMDELPQLWNIIKGDMTLVGPRPTNLENSEKYKNAGDYTREILVCGLTGPYQAEKGHGFDQNVLDKKYLEYITSNPWWKILGNDIRILAKTVKIIFEAKGI